MAGIERANLPPVMSSRREFRPTRGGLARNRRIASAGSVPAPFVLVLAMLVAAPAWAIPITWDGGGGDNRWNTAANWNPNQVPTASDDVTINSGATITVRTPGGNAAARTLALTGGVRIDVQNGLSLAVSQGITVTGAARINIPYTAGSISKSGAGILNLSQPGTVNGDVSVSGGTLTVNDTTNFAGDLTVSAGTLTVNNPLSVGGDMNVSGGTFNVNDALGVGGDLNMSAGTLTLDNNWTVAGNLGQTGGTVTIGTNVTVGSVSVGPGTMNVSGGNLTVTGAASINSGGTMNFTGTRSMSAASLTLASGGTLGLTISGGNTVNLLTVPGAVTLAGTLSLTGNPTNTGTQSLRIVDSTTGPLDISSLSFGTMPAGFAFGVHVQTGDIFLDITQNPIAVDSVSSMTGTCASGTVSWQHTVGANANDRFLIVGVSTGDNTASALPTTVTYGGTALTSRNGDNAGTTQDWIWTMTNPPRGTNTVTLTFPAGSSCFVVAGSVSYSGVNQANPVGNVVSNTETGNTALLAFVTVPVVRGDKVFAVLSSNTASSATPVQSGVTARWSAKNGTEYGTAETLPYFGTTNSNLTLSYNMGPPTSQFWSMSGLPIHAANPTALRSGAPLVRSSGSVASISWTLEPNSDVVGFRVWREAAGRRELLTPGLIAGPALSTRATMLAGSEPGWVDRRPVPGATYLVESLHRDGAVRWSRASQASGKPTPTSAQLLSSPDPAVVVTPATNVIQAAAVQRFVAPAGSRDLQWLLAGSDAIKLVVPRAGVVRVPAESLFAAGLPVGTAVSSLRLFREARPIARTVLAANGRTLQPGDAIEFYGYGMDTRYSGSAVYWLSTGFGPAREIPSVPAVAADPSAATFLASSEIRERLTWFGAAQNGDAEKFFGPAVFSQPSQWTFTLDGLDVAGSGARLDVALQGITEVPHSVGVAVNGLPLGTVDFQGGLPGSASFALPPGALVPGDNVVQLVSGADEDLSLEQSIRLVYPRQTVRGSGALDFTLEGGTATRLQGFDPALTHVLDVTDPDAPVRLETSSSSGAAVVAVTGTGTHHLVAYLDADVAAPASVLPNHPSSLHTAQGADLVILGPSSLFAAMQPLVDRRRSEGLRVALVDVEDVQDEFASGEKSVDAVRGFLQQALQSWNVAPRYLLLLGAASYDPRDYLGLGGDLVSSAVVQTDSMEAVSDSWFVGIPGAERVSVGRLPVRTEDQVRSVVAKILARKEVDARSPVLLASDALGTSDFPEMTSDLRAVLPDAPAKLIVRGSEPDDVLHQRFVDTARAGPALVNYTGHASELFWSGNLHTVADVDALSGGGTSLWIHMTCLTGFFQDPRRQSLAVATLLGSSGGAWGAWGSTSMTYPTDHPALNRALVRALLLEGKTLGEATREALDGVSDADLRSTFVLLGDPSSRAVATKTAALQTRSSSNALGCSSTGGGVWNLAALLALAAWLVTGRRRVPVPSRRSRRPVSPRDA